MKAGNKANNKKENIGRTGNFIGVKSVSFLIYASVILPPHSRI